MTTDRYCPLPFNCDMDFISQQDLILEITYDRLLLELSTNNIVS